LFNKKCTIEYDGTFFSGWQLQKNSKTVQAEVMDALKKIYKVPVNVIGAGRTDSGVHALGQVFNFNSYKLIDNRALLFGLNSILSDNIAVKAVEDVPLDFHARYSAKKKVYLYKIFNSNLKAAFYSKRSWWVKKKMNIKDIEFLMNIFVGEFDFRPFCQDSKIYKNTIRKIYYVNVRDIDSIIEIEICANGFLRKMARLIVGTVIKLAIDDDIQLDNYKEVAKKTKLVAPPEGLYLKEVVY
jgi:tRNA pseudouridine38-40 synthase